MPDPSNGCLAYVLATLFGAIVLRRFQHSTNALAEDVDSVFHLLDRAQQLLLHSLGRHSRLPLVTVVGYTPSNRKGLPTRRNT